MTHPDQHIIELLRSDNPREIQKAIDCIRKQSFAAIRSYVMNNGGSFDDGQDAYGYMWEALFKNTKNPDFILTCKISTYAFQIARNWWSNQLRKRKQQQKHKESHHVKPGRFDPDEDRENRIRYEQLQKAIKELSEIEQAVLNLFFDRKPMKEIADKLGLANAQVAKNIKCRAQKKLKEKLR